MTAIGLLLAVLLLPDDARRAYVQWFVIPVLVLPPLALLLLLPGYWFARKVGQSLLGACLRTSLGTRSQFDSMDHQAMMTANQTTGAS